MNDALAWTGLVLSAVFGVLGVYFYLRSRRVKRLAFAVGTSVLQRSVHADVRITYRAQEIRTLTRVFGFFWNNGTFEVRKSDIPNENWPTVRLPVGVQILSAEVIKRSSDHILLTIDRVDDNSVCFRFSYLNPGDGAVFELLVNEDLGPSDLEVSAPVMGGSAPEFGELGGNLTRELWLTVLETGGSASSGAAVTMWYSQRDHLGIAGHVSYGIAVLLGTALAGLANYLDIRRLHRRLPQFAQQYLKSIASAYKTSWKVVVEPQKRHL